MTGRAPYPDHAPPGESKTRVRRWQDRFMQDGSTGCRAPQSRRADSSRVPGQRRVIGALVRETRIRFADSKLA